jgi:hypothetical protein
MPHSVAIERGFWFLGLFVTGVFLLKLLKTGLFLRYRALTLALAVSLARTLVMLQLHLGSDAYAIVWIATEPIIWLTYVLVVLEISALVFQSYKGLAVLSRRVVKSALLASAIIAVAIFMPRVHLDTDPFPKLQLAIVLEKTVAVSLLMFLAVLSGFMVWYSMPLNKNLIVYALGYSIFFLATSAAMFLRDFAGNAITRIISTVLLAINAGCVLTWLVMIRKSGETEQDRVGLLWHRGAETQLLGKLDALNSALLDGDPPA